MEGYVLSLRLLESMDRAGKTRADLAKEVRVPCSLLTRVITRHPGASLNAQECDRVAVAFGVDPG